MQTALLIEALRLYCQGSLTVTVESKLSTIQDPLCA